MLKYEVAERITMDKIWEHPIFNDEHQNKNENLNFEGLYKS